MIHLLILQRDEFYWHPESKLVFLCNTEKKSVAPFCNVCIFEKTCYLSWTLTLFDISSYDNLYYLGQGQICPLVISMPIAWNLAQVSPTQKTFKKKIKWYHYPISNLCWSQQSFSFIPFVVSFSQFQIKLTANFLMSNSKRLLTFFSN